ncbi:MAG: hypothetical protein ACLTLH_09665, partial [Ruminococcus sp.]
YYSRHTPEQTRFYLQLAEKHHLLVTCGSDFHGPQIKPEILPGTGIRNSLCIENREIPKHLQEAITAAQSGRNT